MEKLSNDLLSIQVSAAGAELCSIQCNGKEYLWQADPAFWNRHSPVLFPIVGRVWDNTYRCEGDLFVGAARICARYGVSACEHY